MAAIAIAHAATDCEKKLTGAANTAPPITQTKSAKLDMFASP
jgi:hypothetical protein